MKAINRLNTHIRITERKSYQTEIVFSTGSMVFSGKCKNISMGGALISSKNLYHFLNGLEILVAIPFPMKQGSIKTKAVVRWTKNDLLGIQFYKRKNARKIYRNRISVLANSIIIPAAINNLSKGGANIVSKKHPILKKGLEIYVTIPFAKKQNHLTRKAIVKWIKANQFGIEFI